MTVIAVQRVHTSLGLASALFLTLTDREDNGGLPPDDIYRDCLASLALNHLLAGVSIDASAAELNTAADAVGDCDWLTDEVRDHLSTALRQAAAGVMPRALLVQIVTAASQRNVHAMVIDCVRSVASDGFSALADAVTAQRMAA